MKKPESKNTGGEAYVSRLRNKRRASARRDCIRILIAEDHTVVRDGLVAIIKQQPAMDVVADTGDGQQAVELWKRHLPDVTLMDLRMTGLAGVDASYAIRAHDPNAGNA